MKRKEESLPVVLGLILIFLWFAGLAYGMEPQTNPNVDQRFRTNPSVIPSAVRATWRTVLGIPNHDRITVDSVGSTTIVTPYWLLYTSAAANVKYVGSAGGSEIQFDNETSPYLYGLKIGHYVAGNEESYVNSVYPNSLFKLKIAGTPIVTIGSTSVSLSQDLTVPNLITSGLVDGVDVSAASGSIDNHAAAAAGVHGLPAGTAVSGASNSETLSNKILDAPTISDFSNAAHYHDSGSSGGIPRIIQNDYDSVCWDYVFTYDGAAYADVSDEAKTFAGTPFTFLEDTSDWIYFGMSAGLPPTGGTVVVFFHIDTPAVGATLDPSKIEYYNGAGWVDANYLDDSVSNFTQSGAIRWNTVGDEAAVEINGTTAYWFRVGTTSNPGTPPTGFNMAFREVLFSAFTSPSDWYLDAPFIVKPDGIHGRNLKLAGTIVAAGGASFSVPLPLLGGGTGGTSAATARTNLDVYSKAETDALVGGPPLRENLTLAVATATVKFTTDIIGNPDDFYLYVNGMLQSGYTVVASDEVTLLLEVATGSQAVGVRFN